MKKKILKKFGFQIIFKDKVSIKERNKIMQWNLNQNCVEKLIGKIELNTTKNNSQQRSREVK